jgi:hypothetical protein
VHCKSKGKSEGHARSHGVKTSRASSGLCISDGNTRIILIFSPLSKELGKVMRANNRSKVEL